MLTHDRAAAVLGTRNRVIDALTAAHHAARVAVDPDLLAACEERVAQLLRVAPPPAPGTQPLDDVHRACLAFTEHWVIDVATMPDALVEGARRHLGDGGLKTFVQALLVVEQWLRLDTAWKALGLADPDSASAESHTDTVPPGATDERSGLGSALAEWQAAVVCLDEVDPITTELVRLRCANHHDCHT